MIKSLLKVLSLTLAISILLISCTGNVVKTSEKSADDTIDLSKIYSELENEYSGKTLKDTYKDIFYIGTIYNKKEIMEQDWDKKTVSTEFNALTAENHMKMKSIQNERGVFLFERGDDALNFSKDNGMLMHGHTLIYFYESPSWLNELKTRQEAIETMREHIFTVMEHYKGDIYSWDVVNEVLDNKAKNGDWKSNQQSGEKNPWYRLLGDDWVKYAFRFAREADPDAVLYLNETKEHIPQNMEAVYNLASELKEEGLIDGVGLQFHVNVYSNLDNLEKSIIKFRDLGLKLSISEVDVSQGRVAPSSTDKFPPEKEIEQAIFYAKLFKIFRNNSDVIERVTFWGFCDEYSWQNFNSKPENTAYPLLFSRERTKKLAYYAVLDPDGFLDKYGDLAK